MVYKAIGKGVRQRFVIVEVFSMIFHPFLPTQIREDPIMLTHWAYGQLELGDKYQEGLELEAPEGSEFTLDIKVALDGSLDGLPEF
jgi:hypothetical protein